MGKKKEKRKEKENRRPPIRAPQDKEEMRAGGNDIPAETNGPCEGSCSFSTATRSHTHSHKRTQRHSVVFCLSNVSFYHKHFKVPEVFQTFSFIHTGSSAHSATQEGDRATRRERDRERERT